ncbi:hypothetical protein SASPL_156101 [Salvia splendens]|uniref:PPM-type phosphatase domain-containing protein n=1 Tax=Salvia splendens TaxID=180675 RepID=A0A8X8YXM2_SALSN|nr:hypothetical protein SASPL_156101 [Salvia splendens]
MGICYSSARGKRSTGWETGDEKADSRLKKSSSGDFSTFISKLSGGGGATAPVGKKGTNQDAMIVWENFCTGEDSRATFCGVFDGHGPYGHMVARRVRDALPVLLRSQWESKGKDEQNHVQENVGFEGMRRFDDFMDEDGCESVEAEEVERVPEMHIPLKHSILKAFKLMDKELKFAPFYRLLLYLMDLTTCDNDHPGYGSYNWECGDSRAVLATRDRDNVLSAVQLTVDLKPNLPREAARIQKCKGRVFALQDEPEVARVWLPNSDSLAWPWPERSVWDVLSNKEAVDIVASAPGRGTAARALVDCATRAWRLKYPTSKNDDCAAVCLFLEHVPPTNELRPPQNDVSSLPEKESKAPVEVETSKAPSEQDPDSPARKESSEIVPMLEEVERSEPTRVLGSRGGAWPSASQLQRTKNGQRSKA